MKWRYAPGLTRFVPGPLGPESCAARSEQRSPSTLSAVGSVGTVGMTTVDDNCGTFTARSRPVHRRSRGYVAAARRRGEMRGKTETVECVYILRSWNACVG